MTEFCPHGECWDDRDPCSAPDLTNLDGFEPGRWWQVTLTGGGLWCETSSETEAREALANAPAGGAKLRRLYNRIESRWVDQ